ncbi:TIGR00159 family protein [Kyrpidia spormannii]|uniref:Diadenylate cyclase n=2 Tax=Kyrpidia spormannii TaxID=2055160 RepID=A0A2K8N2F8_9BACL|nr:MULTISPECIES: diadenylate cyclase CdaA [Kyrpidia]HHY66317.1 TIGR00159 family protein [Alicyclobacillus sp.]ATY83733.1 TIGR00159 family protein [Kyrpidia spormannii]MCL6575304.1 diadenylate cyclase CdaA [Kyrpidia sp.]CAB3389375.1 diadenylate cyclase [Kyrpidia spormannii]CAB3390034.1 diadenylate cyclase [Kyrpidia spormannii]
MDRLWNLLSHFNILTDLLDILLVTYVLYRMILLIRGTRAVQLLKGIVVILIATGLSNYLHLRAMSWLLDKALTIGLFAIPVVFQPELRRALEQLGRGRLFSWSLQMASSDRDVDKIVTELTRAAQVLAKNRIGALIALERETGLSDYVETGIAIDAEVSAELLVNIFIPNTPLHDGAVVVRQGRIAAAGCVLPLSDSRTIDKQLGTRHRAAVGLSEHSDAVAVVVSEETGQISLAAEGQLNRDLDEQALREMLGTMLAPQRGSFSFFHRRSSA